jgi:hypothetical protein
MRARTQFVCRYNVGRDTSLCDEVGDGSVSRAIAQAVRTPGCSASSLNCGTDIKLGRAGGP